VRYGACSIRYFVTVPPLPHVHAFAALSSRSDGTSGAPAASRGFGVAATPLEAMRSDQCWQLESHQDLVSDLLSSSSWRRAVSNSSAGTVSWRKRV